MGKGKLRKFAEMDTFDNVFQYPYTYEKLNPFPYKGLWHEEVFGNSNPIILELGCGRGEYALGIGRQDPGKNLIGVDIKGARMHAGAKQALAEGLGNIRFLRTNIEIIDRFFSENEVSEIWLTFSDPQMKNANKRLSGTWFLGLYRRFLADCGIIHLKTDSPFLYTYTKEMAICSKLPIIRETDDLYGQMSEEEVSKSVLGIKTSYERQWLSRGLKIKYIEFALPHSAELKEPEIEIPKDGYKSHGHLMPSKPKD